MTFNTTATIQLTYCVGDDGHHCIEAHAKLLHVDVIVVGIPDQWNLMVETFLNFNNVLMFLIQVPSSKTN